MLKNFFRKKNIGPFLILGFIAAYFTFRPVITLFMIAIALSAYIAVLVFQLLKVDLKKIDLSFFTKNIKYLLGGLVIIYLLLSISNFRTDSYDGLNFSYRIAYFIKESTQLTFLNAPPKPFLFEFLIGTLWKFVNLNVIAFLMGVICACSISTTYLLFKTYKPEKSTRTHIIYLLITFCNPIFIAFILYQFKPDLIAFTLMNISFISYISLIKSQKYKYLYLLTLCLGLIMIIKVLYAIIVAPLLIFTIIYIFKNNNFKKAIYSLIIPLTLFGAPILIWSFIFGFTIPKFENYLTFPGLIKSNQIRLDYNETIYEQCNQERIINDYSSIIGTPRNLYGKLLQPFYFIRSNWEVDSTISPREPGPFLYLGIIIFLLSLGRLFTNRNYLNFSIKVSLLVALTIFYINVAHVFWYILFLFPFMAAYFVDYIESWKESFARKLVHTLVLLYISTYLLLATIFILKLGFDFKIDNGDYNRIFQTNLIANSQLIEEYSHQGLIFDATVHPYGINFTFDPDSYSNVYANPYFFVSTDLNNNEIKNYLLSKNFKFIMVDRQHLLDSDWYYGCIWENNTKLDKFLTDYTEPIRGKGRLILYRIKN